QGDMVSNSYVNGAQTAGHAALGPQDDEHPAPPGASYLQKIDQSPVTMQSTFAVKGLKMEAQPKATHPRPSKSLPAKPTNCRQQRHPRVRNYNLKD
ncbi:hypothetical protein A6R68_00487, partial [Neotoma lepida]